MIILKIMFILQNKKTKRTDYGKYTDYEKIQKNIEKYRKIQKNIIDK